MGADTKLFTDTIRLMRQGTLVDDLTEQLRALVQRVNETGQKGSLTLTLKVARAAKGSGATLLLSDDVKVKMPLGERGETILFATPEGDLQRQDPRQPSLLPPAAPKPSVVTNINEHVAVTDKAEAQ